MKILNVLNNEDTTTADKLEAVTTFVTNVRTKYGNTDIEIQTVKVPTTEGYTPISLLTNEEKVVVATSQIKDLISMTTAVIENTEGSIFDRVFEGFVAVNPVLVNLDEATESTY